MTSDAGPVVDGGAVADAATTDPDASPADAGTGGDDGGGLACACAADEVCVRDVCIASCGLEAAALEAALGEGLAPVRHWCRGADAVTIEGDTVFALTASPTASGARFEVSRWTLEVGTALPSTAVVGSAAYDGSSGEMVFGSGYLAVSPDTGHAVFGYTTTLAGFVGGVFDLATAGGAVLETSAPGNFDAAFIGPEDYLVNGGGLGGATGQGLHRGRAGIMGGAQVASGMGDASGGVGYWAEAGLVVAGGVRFGGAWPDGSEGGYVFFVGPSALDGAAPLDLFGAASVQRLALPSAFDLLPGGRFVTVEYTPDFSAIDRLELRLLARDAASGVVSSGPARALTRGALFVGAAAHGTHLVLRHAGGTAGSGGLLEVSLGAD